MVEISEDRQGIYSDGCVSSENNILNETMSMSWRIGKAGEQVRVKGDEDTDVSLLRTNKLDGSKYREMLPDVGNRCRS